MLVASMFTPRQEKSTLLTPFCKVMSRSSSIKVASGLARETTTRARSGRATSLTRARAGRLARVRTMRNAARDFVFMEMDVWARSAGGRPPLKGDLSLSVILPGLDEEEEVMLPQSA